MRFQCAVIGAVFCALSSLVALGQGPDTEYVRLYQMIQEADGLYSRDDQQGALDRYEAVLKDLTSFKEANPSWHPNIVKFRMNYINGRIDNLQEALALEQPDPNTPPSPPRLEDLPLDQQLVVLQKQIQELSGANQRLQEKLKEAWAAQPTARNPQALVIARKQIRDLEKERDLLKITLDDRDKAPPSPVDATALEQERKLVVQLRAQLTEEQKRTLQLRAENESLKQQVTELSASKPVTPLPDSDLAQQLTDATSTADKLRQANRNLRSQLVLLETQMKQMNSGPSDASARIDALETSLEATRKELKAAEKEREELAKKLAAAERRLDRRSESEQVEELERQLESAQARLAALEADLVPYTAEELALIGSSGKVGIALNQTNKAANITRPVQQLPPGAGRLFKEAERSIQLGQFEAAESKLNDVLEQDEDNVATLALLSHALIELDRRDEAEKHLTHALSIAPRDPDNLYMMGWLKFQQNKFDDALDSLSLAAQLDGEHAETQFYLGLALNKLNKRAAAEKALRKAIQIRPDWSNAHYELSVIYATQQPAFKELAQWHYQKAIGAGSPRNFDLEKLLDSTDEDAGSP